MRRKIEVLLRFGYGVFKERGVNRLVKLDVGIVAGIKLCFVSGWGFSERSSSQIFFMQVA